MKRNVLIIIVSLTIVFASIPGFCQSAANEEAKVELISKTSEKKVNNDRDDEAQSRLTGYIFKVLAKGIVVTADLDTLKTKCTAKINQMSQEDFRVRYQDFYEHFSSNRVFTDAFGFSNNMTKSEAIELIKTLDKSKIFTLIDLLPNAFIVNEFKRYLFKNKQMVPDSNNTTALWERVNNMITYLKGKYL